MLVKLLPDQVIKEWDVIKYAITQANYEQLFATEEAVRDHLRAIILDQMQVWAITNDETNEFAGIGVTRYNIERAMHIQRLEIYALYAFRPISNRTWAECFIALNRFAKANNCSHIMALSDNENIIKLAQQFGGDTGQRMLVFKV